MEVTTNSVPVKLEANNGSERPTKKNGKEEKSRRKDDKSVEQVMKALNVLETTEEKLAAMCKKYTEIVDENRKLQLTAKQWEKGLHAVLREKEQLQADHSKAVLTRSRLESLCRELQRQNKQIKEESLLKIREEEEKRKEVSAKFNATLAEITALMTSSNEKTNMLRDENVEITKKFKSICDQNAIQQQQVDKMNTQRKLESELTEARLAKQRLEFAAEKEVLLREKQELYMDIHTLHARVNELEASEASLKGQVSLYADRYDEFQNALTKSNEVFGGFKGEMEKMSKKITRLEKETSTWKSRWEKSHQSFLEVVAEKSKCEGELALASRKQAQLEKLCRTLQAERVILLTQIKGLSLSPTSDETAPVPCEDMSADETMQQISCGVVVSPPGDTVLESNESSSEVTAAIDSLSLQTSNSGNTEKPHSDSPDVTNIAQAASDDTPNVDIANIEKSPVVPSEDRSNNQDDVNALSVDKAPANHGEGNTSGVVNRTNMGKSAADKQGGKLDARAANKKGVKPRPGVKETQADKKTKAGDVKKASCDATKEKKDKDNVKVLSGNKNKAEVPGDKKDQKGKGEIADKNDQSLKEKQEIDSSNEEQKQGNDDQIDSNKIAELISEEKKDDSKVKEDEGNLLTRKQDVESRVSKEFANTTPLLNDTNLDKKENVETKLSKDSNVALAAVVIEEMKGPDEPTDVIDPAKVAECKKTGEEPDKLPDEKQHVEDETKKLVEPSTEEIDVKKDVEAIYKIVDDNTSGVGNINSEINSVQPVVVETNRISESNQVIVNSACEAMNVECKVGDVDIGKKVENVVNSDGQEKEMGKSHTTTAANVSEKDKISVASETNLPTDSAIAQVKLTNKPMSAPSKDVKKAKKPEKPKKLEKLPHSAEEKVDRVAMESAKPSLPGAPAEKKEPDSISPSDPAPSSPLHTAPTPSSPPHPAPTPSSAPVSSPASVPSPAVSTPSPVLASSPTSSISTPTVAPAPATTSIRTPSPVLVSSPTSSPTSTPVAPSATTSIRTPSPVLVSSPTSPPTSTPSVAPATTSICTPSPILISSPTSSTSTPTVAPSPAVTSIPTPSLVLASSPTPPTSPPIVTQPPAPTCETLAAPALTTTTPEAAATPSSLPAPQEPETRSTPKAGTATSEMNPGPKQSDLKKEKVITKKRKK